MPKEWIKNTLIVMRSIRSVQKESLIPANFTVPGDAVRYIEIMLEAIQNEESIDFIKFFKPTANPDAIILELQNKVIKKGLDKRYSMVIRNLISNGIAEANSWPFSQLVGDLRTVLAGDIIDLKPEVIVGCLDTLLTLRKIGIAAAETQLKELSTGHLLSQLRQAKANGSIEAIAYCMVPIVKYNPQATNPTPIGYSGEGLSDYNQLVQKPTEVIKEDNYRDLYDIFIRVYFEYFSMDDFIDKIGQQDKLVRFVLAHVINSNSAYPLLSPEVFIKHYSQLKTSIIDDDQIRLINIFHANGDFVNYIISNKYNVDLLKLYRLILRTEQGRTNAFYSFLLELLHKYSKDDWETEFNQLHVERPEHRKLDIVISLVDLTVRTDMTTAFYDALFSYTRNVLNGDVVLPTASNKIEALKNITYALKKQDRITFAEKLGNDLTITSDKPIENVLKIHGDLLVERNIALDSRFIATVLTEICKRKNPFELEWMLAAITSLNKTKVYRHRIGTTKPSLHSLRDRVHSALEETDTEEAIKPLLTAIQDKLDSLL